MSNGQFGPGGATTIHKTQRELGIGRKPVDRVRRMGQGRCSVRGSGKDAELYCGKQKHHAGSHGNWEWRAGP